MKAKQGIVADRYHVACALRVAAEHYHQDAIAALSYARISQQFSRQRDEAYKIAEALENGETIVWTPKEEDSK